MKNNLFLAISLIYLPTLISNHMQHYPGHNTYSKAHAQQLYKVSQDNNLSTDQSQIKKIEIEHNQNAHQKSKEISYFSILKKLKHDLWHATNFIYPKVEAVKKITSANKIENQEVSSGMEALEWVHKNKFMLGINIVWTWLSSRNIWDFWFKLKSETRQAFIVHELYEAKKEIAHLKQELAIHAKKHA